MKYILAIVVLFLSFNAQSGDMYYSAGFTKSQRATVEKCYREDSSFPSQVAKLTEGGDINLRGMYRQKGGYLIMLDSNAYGKWMEYTPLHCDLRSESEKTIERERAAAANAAAEERRRVAAVKAAEDDRKKAEAAKVAAEKRRQVAESEAAEADRKRIEAAKAAKKVRAEQEVKRKLVRTKFEPLVNKCVLSDEERITRVENDRATYEIIIRDRKSLSFRPLDEDYFVVAYSYYTYDKKRHLRWRDSNGPTAGQGFKRKTEATCSASELT